LEPDEDEDYSASAFAERPHLDYFACLCGYAMFGSAKAFSRACFFGSAHVLFATDAPLGPIRRRSAYGEGVEETTMTAIMNGNARRMLRLPSISPASKVENEEHEEHPRIPASGCKAGTFVLPDIALAQKYQNGCADLSSATRRGARRIRWRRMSGSLSEVWTRFWVENRVGGRHMATETILRAPAMVYKWLSIQTNIASTLGRGFRFRGYHANRGIPRLSGELVHPSVPAKNLANSLPTASEPWIDTMRR